MCSIRNLNKCVNTAENSLALRIKYKLHQIHIKQMISELYIFSWGKKHTSCTHLCQLQNTLYQLKHQVPFELTAEK